MSQRKPDVPAAKKSSRRSEAQPTGSGRYHRGFSPSVVPRWWLRAGMILVLLAAFGAAWFAGSVVFDLLKQATPAASVEWPARRAVKPPRMGVREFKQTVELERRFVEDTLRTVLPKDINTFSIWNTCGQDDCVRPSLENLILFGQQFPERGAYVQRICSLSSRYLEVNIARLKWAYDPATKKCLAENWIEVAQSIKRANATAMIAGLLAAALVGGLAAVGGISLLRFVERRINSNDREISIEN
jgi:hypothetical protein